MRKTLPNPPNLDEVEKEEVGAQKAGEIVIAVLEEPNFARLILPATSQMSQVECDHLGRFLLVVWRQSKLHTSRVHSAACCSVAGSHRTG